MHYKVLSTHDEWLPKDSILMWKSNIEGEPVLPTGDPYLAKPHDMAKLEDVVVGLQGFIDYWQSICDHSMTQAYRGSHRHLLQYWTRVKEALDAPLAGCIKCGTATARGIPAV